jgi:hypothetical protein
MFPAAADDTLINFATNTLVLPILRVKNWGLQSFFCYHVRARRSLCFTVYLCTGRSG